MQLRARLSFVVPVLMSAMLAGCSIGGEATAPTASSAPPASNNLESATNPGPLERPPRTESEEGQLIAGIGVGPPVGKWVEVGASSCHLVNIEPLTTGLLAELVWDDPLQHMQLNVNGPDGIQYLVAHDPLAAHAPLRQLIESPIEGQWSICGQAGAGNALTAYTTFGTSFYGPVDEGFTATG